MGQMTDIVNLHLIQFLQTVAHRIECTRQFSDFGRGGDPQGFFESSAGDFFRPFSEQLDRQIDLPGIDESDHENEKNHDHNRKDADFGNPGGHLPGLPQLPIPVFRGNPRKIPQSLIHVPGNFLPLADIGPAAAGGRLS